MRKRIPRIFQQGEYTEGATIELDSNAFQHAIRVLRLTNKDTLILFNGIGSVSNATISKIEKKTCFAEINSLEQITPPSFELCLIQSIIKSDKMDLIIQKAVELGATKIIPTISERCDIKLDKILFEKKYHHWQKIIISACEQSGVNYLPEITPAQSFMDCVENKTQTQRIILDPHAKNNFSQLIRSQNELSIFIGPEGGFTEEEILSATRYNCVAMRISDNILRSETAAIASLAICQYLHGIAEV